LEPLSTTPSQLAQPGQGIRLEDVYLDHFTMVWRGLRRLGVPEASIDDAVQDVFLVVHRRLADFEGRSSLKTWLYGIVLRVAKDYRRARIRQAQRIERLAQLLSVEPASARTPVEDAERREASQALHAILAQLREDFREVLVLTEMEGLSVRDTAEVLGLGVRACQRRLRAARAAFEEQLARYLEPDGRHGR